MLPKILAAFAPPALPAVERVLGSYARLIPVHTLNEAMTQLQSDTAVALILCGVHFDESRMYDLLRFAKPAFPGIPFVCCRVLDAELPRISKEALSIASESLGAAAFIDVPKLVAELGAEHAAAEFRSRVLAHLPGGASERASG